MHRGKFLSCSLLIRDQNVNIKLCYRTASYKFFRFQCKTLVARVKAVNKVKFSKVPFLIHSQNVEIKWCYQERQSCLRAFRWQVLHSAHQTATAQLIEVNVSFSPFSGTMTNVKRNFRERIN